jgi:hypothetical protein
VGRGFGRGVNLSDGVAVGVVVAVAVGVDVAVDVAVGVALGVTVEVAVGVALAVGVGVGVPDGTYVIASTGGLALSRVSNRFAVRNTDSSPNINHPKLLAGSSNHPCTSVTICAELQVY